jgi:NAD(P)-dependent dehydrogenase (short-subunit alcohol dehydrogenase family)
MTTWFITGCSAGLGRALAEAVLARGDRAVLTARDPGSVADLAAAHPEHVEALRLDVTDPAQVRSAAEAARARFGTVDVLVNNAGYGYRAAVEEGEPAAVERLFATNLHGPVALIKEFLPEMRARRSGTIVNLSSISAAVCPAGSGYYSAAKAALEAVTSALRKEVGPLGISAMVVAPGVFRTDFAGRSLDQVETAIPDYAETSGLRRKENNTGLGAEPGDPVAAAEAIVTAATAPDVPEYLLLGSDALAFRRGVDEARQTEIRTWEKVTTGTDFAPAD